MRRNEYALITGGISGFGYEFAKLFAQNDFNLVLVARLGERLEEVANEMREFGVNVITISADLMQPGAAEYIYNTITSEDIKVDILINNAGQGEWGTFTDTDLQRQNAIIQLNVTSLVSLTYYFLKVMKLEQFS